MPIDPKKTTFGRLTALERVNTSGQSRWRCLCSCGKEVIVKQSNLLNGNTQSCGCWKIELLRQRSITHGLSRTREYMIWCNMRRRCYDKNNPGYAYYGGRGIKVCKQWHRFENFIRDMGKRPLPRSTLDRINNDLGYSPRNCRWTTQAEQCLNYKRNVRIRYKGETKTLKEWCVKLGLNYDLTQNRLKVHKWSVEGAFATIGPTSPALVEFRGKKRTLRQWCLTLGLPDTSVYYRIRNGWSVTDALSFPMGACGNRPPRD